ncbi:Peptidase S8/S53 [Gracilaria domingensis]|nr:Peptidase S8/S53 [Gracilaria domingensis]
MAQPRHAKRALLFFVQAAILLRCLPAQQPHHYIVTLASYRPHQLQAAYVRSLLTLTPPGHFRILPRPNSAASLPTDFLVVDTQSDSVLRLLRASAHVLRVAPQRAFTRAPKAVFPPPHASRRPADPPRIHAFNAASLWRLNHTGAGVHVAVFDTGIARGAHFPNLRTVTDWTRENTTDDSVGHGTFVASVIAGSNPSCPGLAPHANLHIFRVFTGAQVSYTSWFLDAFNYALHIGIDVLNLSIGGPDFVDIPFVEKINELTASGVIIVSAIGNDGPLWGTLNNPADMMDVVGVAGAEPDATLAPFSSRGMTMHEQDPYHPRYGRVKPDLVAYARSLTASSHHPPSCTRLSGTSVASPVVAAAIVLLISSVPAEQRKRVVNLASVKIALINSAARLRHESMYEQGAGLLRIEQAFDELTKVRNQFSRVPSLSMRKSDGTVEGPKADFFPAYFDLTKAACPYMWPHCTQPLIQGAKPVTLNVTILNPAGVEAALIGFEWESADGGKLLTVDVTPPQRFWPWAGGLGIHLSAASSPSELTIVEGVLRMRIVSIHEGTHSDVGIPIRAAISPTLPRSKRLLWDIFHSVRYPPGYVPRDNLADSKDMLDWLGDHPHTNFHALYRSFVDAGFHVDILDHSLECLDMHTAAQYGALLLFDSEDYFSPAEQDKLEILVKEYGLSLIVAAEWYNADLMQDIRFEDDNTRSFWTPIIGGANVPALNVLLSPFGIGFGDAVISGSLKTYDGVFRVESGVPIVSFPPGGELLHASFVKLHESRSSKPRSAKIMSSLRMKGVPVFGLTKAGQGAVMVYGDTNCIDTAYGGTKCYKFFVEAVHHTILKCAGRPRCQRLFEQSMKLTAQLSPSATILTRLAPPLPSHITQLLLPHSSVLRRVGSELSLLLANGEYVSQKCSKRSAEQTRPNLRTGRSDLIKFPSFDYAVGVGSERNYYQDVGRSAWPTWEKSQWNGVNVFSVNKFFHVFSSRGSIMKPRSLVCLLLGICLLCWSISFPRYAGKVRRGRRTPCHGGSSKKTKLTSSSGGVVSSTSSREAYSSLRSSGTSYLTSSYSITD